MMVIGANLPPSIGRVESVAPYASLLNGKDSSRIVATQATIQTVVKLDRPSGKIFPGSKVNVEIIVAQRQRVVTLPSEAIQHSDDEPFVWVKDPQGRLTKRSIDLGLEGLTATEIKSGLRPGETVHLLPPNQPLPK
jgi:HlyD family secretion protein